MLGDLGDQASVYLVDLMMLSSIPEFWYLPEGYLNVPTSRLRARGLLGQLDHANRQRCKSMIKESHPKKRPRPQRSG